MKYTFYLFGYGFGIHNLGWGILPNRITQQEENDDRQSSHSIQADPKTEDLIRWCVDYPAKEAGGLVDDGVHKGRQPDAACLEHGVSDDVSQKYTKDRHHECAHNRLPRVIMTHPDNRIVPCTPNQAEDQHAAFLAQADKL